MPDAMAVKAAEWMGWRQIHEPDDLLQWCRPNGMPTIAEPPDYKSIDAVRELEDEIERRGLDEDYMNILIEQMGIEFDDPKRGVYYEDTLFKLIRATAAQRLEAVCAVIDREAKRNG